MTQHAQVGRAWLPERGVFVALALLALALKVMIPPGTMIAQPSQGAGFPLVLCTAQGPLIVDSATQPGAVSATKEKPANKSPHDAPCLFAGHGAAAPIPDLRAFEPVEMVTFEEAAQSGAPSPVTPGRGLAAPPPPPRGPPARFPIA